MADTVVSVSEPLDRWYRATIGTASEREVLRRLQEHLGEPFDSRKIATHLRQSSPVARTVVAIAHLFGGSAVEALIAAGLLSPQDLHAAEVSAALREASDKALADEVTRRLVSRTYGESPELHAAMSEVEIPPSSIRPAQHHRSAEEVVD